MSDELAAPDDRKHKIHQKYRKKQSFRENERSGHSAEMLPDDQEDQPEAAFRRTQHRKIYGNGRSAEEKGGFVERKRILYPGALMKTEFSRSQDKGHE